MQKINTDLNDLGERNAVLERPLNIVLRSNMIKETSFKTRRIQKKTITIVLRIQTKILTTKNAVKKFCIWVISPRAENDC